MSKTSMAFGALAALAASGIAITRQNTEQQLRSFDYDEAKAEEYQRTLEREREEEAELAKQVEEYQRNKKIQADKEQVIYDAAKDKRARKNALRLARR